MLQVGIHSNIKIGENTGLTEKGALKVHLVQAGAEVISTFAAFSEEKDIEKNEAGIFIFPPNILEYGKTTTRGPEAIATDLQRMRGWLKGILKIYLTTEQLTSEFGAMSMFTGLGVNEENFNAKLQTEEFVLAASANLFSNFLEVVKNHDIAAKTSSFRIKLTRQSKKSNFPTFPKGKDAWIESMDVAEDATKVVFTKYEIENGLNSSARAKAEETPKEEEKSADALFDDGDDTTPATAAASPTSEDAPSLG